MDKIGTVISRQSCSECFVLESASVLAIDPSSENVYHGKYRQFRKFNHFLSKFVLNATL